MQTYSLMRMHLRLPGILWDFTTFALSAIMANYMILNLIYILLTASARDHIPILCTERPCAREAYH